MNTTTHQTTPTPPSFYRFRSEVPFDVGSLLQTELGHKIHTLHIIKNHTMEVTLSTHESLDSIRRYMREVTDGHVMLESVNYAYAYTGERYYKGCIEQ